MNTALITEMKIRSETAHMTQPLDIERMLRHNKEIGRNFTAVMFAQGDTNNVTYLLDTLNTMAKNRDGDLATLKNLAATQLGFYGYRYLNYYAMNDIHSLLLKFAFAVKDAADYDELSAYLRTLQCYTGQLSYWIDLALPWSALSKKYDEVMFGGE